MPTVIVSQNCHHYYLNGLHNPPVTNRWTNTHYTDALQANFSSTARINITLRNTINWLYDKHNNELRFISQQFTRIHPPGITQNDDPDHIELPPHATLIPRPPDHPPPHTREPRPEPNDAASDEYTYTERSPTPPSPPEHRPRTRQPRPPPRQTRTRRTPTRSRSRRRRPTRGMGR